MADCLGKDFEIIFAVVLLSICSLKLNILLALASFIAETPEHTFFFPSLSSVPASQQAFPSLLPWGSLFGWPYLHSQSSVGFVCTETKLGLDHFL